VVFGLVLAHNIVFFRYVYRSLSESDGYRNHSGDILGGDFIVFYQAANIFQQEPENLYNFEYFSKKVAEFGDAHSTRVSGLFYGYPPLFTYLVAKILPVNFFQAYITWLAISATLFIGALVALLRNLGASWKFIALTGLSALAFQPFSFSCLLSGQTSACATAIFVLFFLLFDRGRTLLAGMVLSLSYYKPPLFAVLVLTMLCARQWRVITGFLMGGSTLVAATVLTFGGEQFLNYLQQVSQYRYGVSMAKGLQLPLEFGVGALAAMEGLRLATSSALQVILGGTVVVTSYALGSYLRRFSDDRDERFLWYATVVGVSLILSLHMFVYDLAAFFPFIVGTCFVAHRRRLHGWSIALFCIGVLGLCHETFYRSVPVGDVTVNGTTIAWLLVLMSLRSMLISVRRPIKNGEIPSKDIS